MTEQKRVITIKTVTVKNKTEYRVFIGANLLEDCADIVKNEVFKDSLPRRIFIVSDTTVAPLYADRLTKSLENAGFEVHLFVFSAGEEHKTPNTLLKIIETASDFALDRHDVFAALGGGVTGDLCGLAASLYMRGVRYLQFPTTLLSCIDSSVGGKTACNTAGGKNLMGAFYNPCAVFADTNTLCTLSKETYNEGIAEAVKYGLISDKTILEMLLSDYDVSELIYRCVGIKAEIVSTDFTEQNRRKILNFGHTAAHAFERASGYKISHGNAVAAGIVTAVKYSRNIGVCDKDLLPFILPIYQKFSLPLTFELLPHLLIKAAFVDKKSNGENTDLVLLQDLEKPVILTVSKDSLKDFFGVNL
ncbi:MAG: 3-dehydroquinate synthase [Oscillospiraceae bacterium]|nr:3-dehydroquinate synthase [Candidatus Equicaccousia limihippi]